MLPARSRKITTYGKRRVQVLAVRDGFDSDEERIEVYKDVAIRFRVSSPARRSVISSPNNRPALVSRHDSNNEVQRALVPKPKKQTRRVIAASEADVDFEEPPRASTSRLLIPESSDSSVGSSAPPSSPGVSKRLRSAKPPAAVVNDLTAQEDETDEEDSQRTVRPRARSVVARPAEASSSKTLLEACKQQTPIAFSDVLHDIGKRLALAGSNQVRPRWTKMAEASYSEVFAISTSPQKVPKMEDVVVVKVIPLRGDAVKRNGQLVELPQETTIADAERELRITRLLDSDGFVGLKGAIVVQGSYPSKLLSTWDAFAASRPSENVRPDAFPSAQQYLLLCLPHCGAELETFKVSSWVEATSILWQVALNLAKAERSLQFEHRDLHWGNILIQRVPPTAAVLALAKSAGHPPTQALAALSLASPADWPTRLSPARSGVRATIIDYTLSRITTSDGAVLCDDFKDDEVFAGQGDEQFEVYRRMRELTKGDWSASTPATNTMWLLYLANKLLTAKGLKAPTSSKASSAAPLRGPGTASDVARQRAAAHIVSSEKEAYATLVAAQKMLIDGKDAQTFVNLLTKRFEHV